MQCFYDRLDRILTTVLIILVVAMVCSITTEILLNAAVQPLVSGWLQLIDDGISNESIPEADHSTPLRHTLEWILSAVANASAPVNTASQTLLVWIGILGSALAFRQRAHLGVDALVRLYPPKIRLILDYISTVFVGLFSLTVLTIGGGLVCERAFSYGSKMPGFEMLNRGWFYLVLILTGALNLLYCVYHIAHPKPVGGLKEEKKRNDS